MNKRSGIESRKRILHAAMEEFSRKGYAKANIREIALGAGISIGGVYLYFKNKEQIYKNIINEKRRELENAIEKCVEKNLSASTILADFLRMYLEYAIKHKEFILLHIREHGFTFGMKERKQFIRNQQKLIESILVRGMKTNEFRKCNASDMAKLIMGSLRGIILSMALDNEITVTPKMLKEFIFQGLLTGRKEKAFPLL